MYVNNIGAKRKFGVLKHQTPGSRARCLGQRWVYLHAVVHIELNWVGCAVESFDIF